jgi:hypothetical protein
MIKLHHRFALSTRKFQIAAEQYFLDGNFGIQVRSLVHCSESTRTDNSSNGNIHYPV